MSGAPLPDRVDALVVGAGFSGLYLVHRLRTAGFDVHAVDTADGVGGTWYWNRYPGCRCDVPSWEYSYSFSPELQQEWTWTERYPAQPEILRYLEHVADRFDLRRSMTFSTRVDAATFSEDTSRWTVTTDRGTVDAGLLVMATGGLSTPKDPGIPGANDFAGTVVFTSRWPHGGLDVAGKRVGVIGTGSSGIQVIPMLAADAEHLTVFQRTAQFTIPARNRSLPPDEMDAIKARYSEIRAEARRTGFGLAAFQPSGVNAVDVDEQRRRQEFDRTWNDGGPQFLVAFDDLVVDPEANEYAAEYVRERIAEIVDDASVAELLTPKGYPLGCKRLCNDTNYYETFNRSNVDLVDVSSTPIERFTTSGLQVGDEHHELDIVVFATGFDALTGALEAIDIRGRDGRSLHTSWSEGPRSYLGLMVPGFPNMFTVTGPGSPSLLSNMVTSIEQHVDWITQCALAMRDRGDTTIDASADAADEWSATVQEIASATLFAAPNCSSYYRGDNIDGKSRTFLPFAGGVHTYQGILDDVVADGYRGFGFSSPTTEGAQ